MWIDAEAQNKFLEDLLQEYAIKLDEKETKLELLRNKVRNLEHELKYHRDHQFPGSIYATPPIVTTDNKSVSFNLNLPAVSTELENLENENAYHVIARIYGKTGVAYNYYINKTALLSAKDRIGMLTYLHKQVIDEMQRQLEKSS